MIQERTIQVPASLYKQLESQLKQSSFKKIDDLAAFILQNYLDQQGADRDKPLKTEDDQAVLKRLEDLGYM
ncbi:MAG: hypothetical protein P8X42_06545 [Calditrichaceae bacterium]|jgi:hypothetical protein